jgi:class 3 adenylate cyclase
MSEITDLEYLIRLTHCIVASQAGLLGKGNLHEPEFSSTAFQFPLLTYTGNETFKAPGHCVYSITLYFSKDFHADSGSRLEIISAMACATVFALMALCFCMYDRFVRRRNAKIVGAAARSNAIVSSLFPKQVRDRMYAEKEEEAKTTEAPNLKTMMHAGRSTEQEEVDDNGEDFMYKSKPIADLFPETTILFADIAGFTAWSSVREPCQVFILLETLFRAFDSIAKKRGIFKVSCCARGFFDEREPFDTHMAILCLFLQVETVGDCYVAVCGLPEPRKDHAVAVARFARDSMAIARTLTKRLEVTLGPDTAELAMRMGIHSGPVTAGVLRGERSRFQLFGDTMNTAARMESNGIRDKIQVSQETADLLHVAGKGNWLTRRDGGKCKG